MSLGAGTRIGPYEILGEIGAGGMGNVYRATDTRLGRDVAIKTLPDHLASDPRMLERFEREARFLASLNHPTIAAIYGLEQHGGDTLLILEFVPGDTVEQLLQRGPLPPERVIRIGVDVATALEAAHAAGIVHRDLKPSNVKITPDGRVKLLDFGVAKHMTGPADGTVAEGLTHAGAAIGTPAYMSPEQITGDAVDRSTDIWAFGCLLYEMLTARRPFEGATYVGLADAIRSSDPDWAALPRGVPDALRRLIRRCLVKDTHDRLHDIGDARIELRELAARTSASTRPLRRRTPLLAGAVIVLALVAAAAVAQMLRRDQGDTTADAGPARVYQLTSRAGVEEFPAWSPDGRAIVYSGDVGGIRKLFLRRLDTSEDEQLTRGPHDEIHAAWSPDGTQLWFVRAADAGRRLEPSDVFSMYELPAAVWVLDLRSRAERRTVRSAYHPTVSPDGKWVAVDASWAGPRRIWLVDANGLNPQQVTSEGSEAVAHMQPRWSPDGRALVFQRNEQTKFDISVVELATRRIAEVTNDSYREINPVFGADARTIYFASDRGGGVNVWRASVGADWRPAAPLQQLTNGAGQDVQIAVSRDGRVAFATLRQNADLWRLPLDAAGTPSAAPEPLIASTREDSRGAWSPDGGQLAFNSDRAGDMNVWVHDLRANTTRQVTRGAGGDYQPQWSPDGRTIVFFSSRSGNADIWTVELASGALRQLTHDPSIQINPFFSPDGRQIAFQSDASGRMELWVAGADGSGARRVTDVGVYTHFARWLPDGNVYFRSIGSPATFRVPAAGGAVTQASTHGGGHTSFLPDGKRFVDVAGHKVVWLYGLDGSARQLLTFDDPEVRIDYPVVSPDGRWVVFDRLKPEGGDIWVREPRP